MGNMEKYHSVTDLVNQARKERKWMYHPYHKKWWNPDEFSKEFALAPSTYFNGSNDIKLLDPFEGIKEANEKKAGLEKNIETFSERVLRYYQDKSVDPPPRS